MSHSPVTLAAAGILGLIYFVLSAMVVRQRMITKTLLGDGGKDAMTKAIRAHANFAEYVPMALILMAGIEAAGAPRLLVCGLAAALILARVLHPLGLHMAAPNVPRAGGAMLTFAVLIIASITALTFTF